MSNLRYLIAALTIATFVTGASAFAAYLWLFPPRYRGWSEIVDGGAGVAGWVADGRAPENRVRVQLYVGEQFISEQVADLPRPDVVRAGHARDERCGYRVALPRLAPGVHVARVYAVHEIGSGRLRTLQIIGAPLRFTVAPS